MASLKDLSRKIKSVSNTQKTTRAMKLVSTAKLRRAEELAKRSRLYADKMQEVLGEIAWQIRANRIGGIESRCFLPEKDIKVVDVIFVTADKGLCGGFNMQTIKRVMKELATFKEKKVKVRLRGIGKKGIDFFTYREVELFDEVRNLSSAPDVGRSDEFIEQSINDFKDGKTDEIILIYNGYKNVITQEMNVNRLLPIHVEEIQKESVPLSLLEVESDDDEKMLDQLVTKYVSFSMYYGLLNSLAAEHSARMQAMDSATNNAKEMVKQLKTKYNKARQEAITTELIEIISGVESMK